MLEEVSGDSIDEDGFLLEEEAPDEEEFVFGEDVPQKRGTVPATLPPDAPAVGSGTDASTQEALIGGIRELVNAVKGLSLEGIRVSTEGAAVPAFRAPMLPEITSVASVPETMVADATVLPAELVSDRDDQNDARIKELYETIEALRRQNEELKRSLENAEAAPAQPEPEPVGYEPGSTIFEPEPAGYEPESMIFEPEPEYTEPAEPEEDPWTLAWKELAAAGPLSYMPEAEIPQDTWDLEPVPPTPEDIAERERIEAEVQDIITRSASLISNMTVLERMAANSETVMEITLDELIAQIQSEQKR